MGMRHGLRCAYLNLLRYANSHLVCLVPRRLSLDVSLRAKEGGKEKRLRFSSLSFPWSLAFVTSRSHIALAYVRDQSAKKQEASKKEQETDYLVITPVVEILFKHYRHYRISSPSISNLSIPFFVFKRAGVLTMLDKESLFARCVKLDYIEPLCLEMIIVTSYSSNLV